MEDLEQLYRAVEQVESGGNPRAVSPKGALGPMQTMPTTLTSPGYGVAPAKDSSIDEQRRVGRDYLKAMLSKYDDLPTALTAYNWGPGNADKWLASGADVSKLPKETQVYREKVARLLTPGSAPASKRPTYDALKGAVQAASDARLPDSEKFKPNYVALQLGTEDAVRRNSIEPGVLGMVGAAMAGNTDSRLLRLFADEFPEEPGFKPDFAKLPLGADRDLVEAYARTKSTLAADKVLRSFDDEVMRQETVARAGPAGGFALSLGGEVASVTNWLTGFAATASLARTGYGSMQALRSGNYAKGIASNVAENVISGTVVEAVLSSAEGKFDLQSTGINLVADALIGAGVGGWGARTASKQHAQDLINATRAATVAKELEYAARAESRLGPNPTVDEVSAEIAKIKKEEQLAIVPTHTARSDVFDIDRLVPEEAAPAVESTQAMAAPTTVTKFADPNNEARIGRGITGDTKFKEMADLGVFKYTDDFEARKAQLDALPTAPGVYLAPNLQTLPQWKRRADVVEQLRTQLIPDVSIHFTDGGTGLGTATGISGIIKPNVSMMAVRPDGGLRVVAHEFAHVVFAHQFAKASPELQQAMVSEWQAWRAKSTAAGKAQEAMLQRSPIAASTDMGVNADGTRGLAAYTPAVQGTWAEPLSKMWDSLFDSAEDAKKFDSYFRNFDEYAAEQLVKYMEAKSAGEVAGPLTVPQQLAQMFASFIREALALFKLAKEKNILAPGESFKRFFDDLIVGNTKSGLSPLDVEQLASPDIAAMASPTVPQPNAVVNELLNDPDALKYGLTTLPMSTPAERKKAQAILALHKQADSWAVQNPKDELWDKRAKNWADNDVFNVASTGLIMLKSENNLVRMLASELLEDASGVSGKKGATASITKYLVERRILGNALPEIEEAYGIWSANKKGSNLDNLIGGEYRKEFNRSVFELVERQGKGENITPDTPENAALLKAATVVQATFKRSATEQINANTLGSGALEDGVGYMPHKINPKMVMALTNEQTRVLHSALTDQFVTIEGWDMTFSDMLASKYLERVQRRAHGDYASSVGGNSADTADLVRETLMGMNLPEQIVADHMARFTKGAANFTKKRLDLDLHRVYDVDGKPFKLLDVFETDPIALMRAQAQRASGDVALASKGIKGKPGMQLMREAMRYGETGKKATDAEFGAFDQMAAEFFGDPFGSQSTRWMERAMSANTLIRLGGMGFNQLAETLNGVFHVGVLRTFDSITSLPRLKAEIDALVRGEKVDNPILSSIEVTGTEFGTDSHRVVLPYDSPDHAYPTYGKDTLTVTDRLLRGGGYLQAKLSGWRLIHSTQQRGMAEQITRKVMRYIKEGKEDEALKGFGVNDRLRAAITADLDKIAVFDGAGRLEALDITKMTDSNAASELVQVIHRGVNQIVQGTFIGERGKWVHDGWLKLLTQFRSFSITSMEKQWGRQRNSHGTFAAFGMLLGAMSMAAPIYMARVYAASVGREDQQEYLEKRLTPQGIAKGTMNYVAMSGMFGDFADLLTAVAPDEVKDKLGIQLTGTRAGTESEFIGTFLAPSAGLVDDAWKYLQSPDDLKEGAKLLPFGRLPYLIPLLNTVPKPERD